VEADQGLPESKVSDGLTRVVTSRRAASHHRDTPPSLHPTAPRSRARAMESRKNKLQALAAYKRAREGGERTYTERDAKIYDEVTETEYKVRRA
jgi:hypothetical protein